MPTDEKNALATLVGGLGTLPAQAKTTFIAAASRVLGGLASFPAAWLRRPIQAFEDTTDARSVVAKGLAQALVEQAKGDPLIMRAVADTYLPEVVRKTANKARTVAYAAEEYERAGGSERTEAPDDDWINKFIRYSEDASSERLQLLFGKILAGELVNPGSFSPATLRAVSELTQSMAEDFTWAWSKNIDDEIWRGPEFVSGEPWMKLTRLRDAGLLSPVDSAIHQPPFNPFPAMENVSLWMIGGVGDTALAVAMRGPVNVRLNVVNFTKVGMEMGQLLPVPDYEQNLREVAAGFPKPGVAWIKMLRSRQLNEVLWSAQ